MAADTCISTPDEIKEPFGGIKVLAIPVKIQGPVDANTGSSELLYEKTAGLCFSGSFVTAFLVKEIISEVLFNLQSLDPPTQISFEHIAGLAYALNTNAVTRGEVDCLRINCPSYRLVIPS